MEVFVYPAFVIWLDELLEADVDVHVDVLMLIEALRIYGRGLSDPESHPVVTSQFDLHALRRTPPSIAAPLATGPPVLRVLYAFCRTADGEVAAVVLIGGDKTELGNRWYPSNLAEAERRLTIFCGQRRFTPIKRSRTSR
jgi:hypothetical protein